MSEVASLLKLSHESLSPSQKIEALKVAILQLSRANEQAENTLIQRSGSFIVSLISTGITISGFALMPPIVGVALVSTCVVSALGSFTTIAHELVTDRSDDRIRKLRTVLAMKDVTQWAHLWSMCDTETFVNALEYACQGEIENINGRDVFRHYDNKHPFDVANTWILASRATEPIPPTTQQIATIASSSSPPTNTNNTEPKRIVEVTVAETVTATPTDNDSNQPNPTLSLSETIVATLAAFNVKVTAVGEERSPSFVRVKVRPELGVKVSAISQAATDLKVQLAFSAVPMISPEAGYVAIDIPRSDRQTCWLRDFIAPGAEPSDVLAIPIGISLSGRLVYAILSDPNTCHFLVGGTTGSGKSEFLRAIVFGLMVSHPSEQLQIILIDPKRVTFPEFESCPWLRYPIIKDASDCVEVMTELVDEMERRYRLFETAKVSDISSYNKTNPPIPRIVCIFDEYADFMTDDSTKALLEVSIKRLGAKARASGIHLVFATQRPDGTVVTPLIRSNLPGRIALATASEADSKIILGGNDTRAKYLLGKGDLLFGSERLQSLFVSSNEITSFLQSHPNDTLQSNDLANHSDAENRQKNELRARLEGLLSVSDSIDPVDTNDTPIDNVQANVSNAGYETEQAIDESDDTPDTTDTDTYADTYRAENFAQDFPEWTEQDMFNRIANTTLPPGRFVKEVLKATNGEKNKIARKAVGYLVRKYGDFRLMEKFREYL